MSSKKIPVATYKRKSKEEEVDREEPLARQNILIETARNWKGETDREEIVKILVDQDVSGSTDQRPGLQKLLSLARKRKIQRIYVASTNRFFRDLPNGNEILYELTEILGIEMIFGDLLVDPSNPYYKRFLSQRFVRCPGDID